MADTNGDGIDDTTGQPVAPAGGLQPFDPGLAGGGAYSTNLMASAAAMAAQSQAEQKIFAGYKPTYSSGSGDTRKGQTFESTSYKSGHTAQYTTRSQLLHVFDNLDRDHFLKIRNMLAAAGVIPVDSDPYTVRSAFSSVLGDVEDMNAQGINLSAMGYVKNLIRMNGIDPSDVTDKENFQIPNDPNQPFTGSKTQTSRSVSQVGEGEAWYTLQQNLKSLLGRDPSDEEVRDFTYRMNQLAAQNPSISKTITQYKNGEAVSSNTKSIDPGFSGADVQEAAYHDAVNDPQYAEYQSASTYFNAAVSALGAIGQPG